MIGSGEFAVIMLLALLFFGPEKLPELARSLGKAYAEFKKAQEEVERQIEMEILEERDREIKRELSEILSERPKPQSKDSDKKPVENKA